MKSKNLLLIEILKVILKDVEMLEIDYSKNDNTYYYGLVRGNLKDLIRTEEGSKKK